MYNRKYPVGVLLTNLVLTELLEGFPTTLSVRGKLPYYSITHTSAVSTTSAAACGHLLHLAAGYESRYTVVVGRPLGLRSSLPSRDCTPCTAGGVVVTGGTTDRAGMC